MESREVKLHLVQGFTIFIGSQSENFHRYFLIEPGIGRSKMQDLLRGWKKELTPWIESQNCPNTLSITFFLFSVVQKMSPELVYYPRGGEACGFHSFPSILIRGAFTRRKENRLMPSKNLLIMHWRPDLKPMLSIQKFRLHLTSFNFKLAPDMNHWISAATNRNVKDLEIHLEVKRNKRYILPQAVFTSKTNRQ